MEQVFLEALQKNIANYNSSGVKFCHGKVFKTNMKYSIIEYNTQVYYNIFVFNKLVLFLYFFHLKHIE